MYCLILSRRNSGGSSPRGPSVQWLYAYPGGIFPLPDGLQPVLRVHCVGNPRLLQMVENCPEYLIEGDAVVEISLGRGAGGFTGCRKLRSHGYGLFCSLQCVSILCV